MGVPTNKLHACGYISIGCEPCTRPVLPNQHEREGRWWWEDATGGCGVCVGGVGGLVVGGRNRWDVWCVGEEGWGGRWWWEDATAGVWGEGAGGAGGGRLQQVGLGVCGKKGGKGGCWCWGDAIGVGGVCILRVCRFGFRCGGWA